MKKACLVLFLLCCALGLQARSLFSRDVWLTETHTAIGVNVLLLDESGFIWLGTDEGLFRFNGQSVTSFPGGSKFPVSALSVHDGMVWVGYKNGLLACMGKDGVWRQVCRMQSGTAITGIHADAWNTLLILTTAGNGIVSFYQGNGMPLTTAEGLSDDFVYGLSFVGKDRHLLAATDRGVSRMKLSGSGLRVAQLNTANGLPDNIVRVVKSLPGSDMVWAGMQEAGIALLQDTRDDHLRVKSRSVRWRWGQVNDLLPLSGSEAWIVTESGYLLYAQLTGDSLQVEPLLKTKHQLRALLADPAGNIWCATEQGLMEVITPHISSLGLPVAYDRDRISAMTCDTAGNIWYAMDRDVYCYHPATEQPGPSFRLPNPVTALHADSSGRIWSGTLGGGVFLRDMQGRAGRVPQVPGLDRDHILDIGGNAHSLWLSGLNGVEQFALGTSGKNMEWQRHHDKKIGLGSDYIYQLYVSPEGKVWMATDGGGLGCYDKGSYTTAGPIPGFSSHVVYSVAAAGPRIWINTLQDGLFFLEDRTWKRLSSQGFRNPDILALEGAPDGRVLVVHQRGLSEWYPEQGVFRHYNRRLGTDMDSSSAQLNCIAADRAGNVYIPGEQGFVCVGMKPRFRSLDAAVRLKEPKLFLRPVDRGKYHFAWDENHLTFSYEGLSYTNAERLHFRYRLEGFSNDWVVTNDEAVTFPRLPAGSYLFRVQVSLTGDFTGAKEAVYAFDIATPLWKQIWFVVLILVLLVLAGFYYVKVREKNLRKLSLLQKERMTFEYEHLKSQVNPHFLFNSLNTLVQIIDEDRDLAVEYAIHLSDLYRNMLAFQDRELISLAEEWSLLEQYLYIQQNRFGPALLIRREIPEPILQSGRIVPMALQLLVENAIKHNVVSREFPLEILISADQQDIAVINRLQPKQSREKGAGLGIANLKNRYGLLSDKPIAYGVYEDKFVVKLPLL